MTTPESLDTFSTDDLLQDPTPNIETIPVRVEGPVLTDELPTNSTYRRVVLAGGDPAVRIVNQDPRRKRIVMWMIPVGAGVDTVCIGSTRGQADSFSGAILASPNAVTRYEFSDRGELWAKTGDIGSSGVYVINASTAECVLSIVEEKWSR
jgi:hypothetical protein